MHVYDIYKNYESKTNFRVDVVDYIHTTIPTQATVLLKNITQYLTFQNLYMAKFGIKENRSLGNRKQ
jgi:hypothetical protein